MTLEKANIKYIVVSTLMQIAIIAAYIWGNPFGPEIITIGFAMMILFLIKFRTNLAIFVFFAFFTLYNYATIKVFYQDYNVSYFYNFRTKDWINQTFFIHSFFIFTLGNTISRRLLRNKLDLNIESFKSRYLFWFLVVIGIFMIQFGIKGPNMLVSGGYGLGQEKSSLHEYFILVFFLIILVAKQKNELNKIVIFLLYAFYCAKTVLHGGRVEALEITLLGLMYYWLLPKKENKPLLIVLILFALYINHIVGTIRTNPFDFIKGEYAVYLNPFYSYAESTKVHKALGNNEGDVIQASNRLLALIHNGYLNSAVRVKSFLSVLATIVLPSSALPDYANLAAFHQVDSYRSGGGGLVSTYFYVWLGFVGPPLMGFLIGYFINKGYDPKSNIGFKIYAVIIIAMSPRWFAYGPNLIFKFCFLTAMIYLFFKFYHANFLRKKTPQSLLD